MRSALLFTLWLPLTALASGVGVPASDFAGIEIVGIEPATTEESVAPGEKLPEQLNAPVLAYDQPVRAPAYRKKREEEVQRTDKRDTKLPVSLRGGSGGGVSSGASQRTGSGLSANGPPDYLPSPTNPAPPSSLLPQSHGGPGDSGDSATARRFTASARPCARGDYHNTVMTKGLDVARLNCKLYQMDKNRPTLWGLTGGEPVKRWVTKKQLDRALDVSKVK